MRKLTLILSTLFISNSVSLSAIVNAEENTNYSTTEKQYEYSLKYNYEEIYALLKLTEEEFNLYWQQGLYIAEMAIKQGIDRSVLEEYFVTFHHKVLREWQIRDEVPEHLYFTQVYRLKDEINKFIDRHLNKDQAQN
ncbi:hypothetical protein ACIQXW_13410 [Lysinibacillus sp. NPDC097162]|uniref:hypothetical protein n=1 Tax=Lysinibacillus sp. NPDC097162 TaxID=3364140 RepID=UPI0038268AE9